MVEEELIEYKSFTFLGKCFYRAVQKILGIPNLHKTILSLYSKS